MARYGGFHVRLNEGEEAELKELAAKLECSMTAAVRHAVHEAVVRARHSQWRVSA